MDDKNPSTIDAEAARLAGACETCHYLHLVDREYELTTPLYMFLYALMSNRDVRFQNTDYLPMRKEQITQIPKHRSLHSGSICSSEVEKCSIRRCKRLVERNKKFSIRRDKQLVERNNQNQRQQENMDCSHPICGEI